MVTGGDRHDLDAVDQPVGPQVGLEEGPGAGIRLEGKDLGLGRACGGDHGIETGERAHVEYAAAGLATGGEQVAERPFEAGPAPPPERPRDRVQTLRPVHQEATAGKVVGEMDLDGRRHVTAQC